MDPEGVLLALAEIAVAFAGFAGVVTAFQTRARPWSGFDSGRLWNMLRFALALLFFSLLPFAWIAAGRSPWMACSAILGLTVAVQAVVSVSLAVRRGPGVQPVVATSMAVGGLISAAVLLMNVLGRFFQQSFTGYCIGLFWLLIGSALFFSRLVYLGLGDVDREGSER